jgi:hypothetical protein
MGTGMTEELKKTGISIKEISGFFSSANNYEL